LILLLQAYPIVAPDSTPMGHLVSLAAKEGIMAKRVDWYYNRKG
jgi:hypothetical protein